MKRWQIGVAILGAGAAAVGLSAIATNPGPKAYEDYALEQLTDYLTTECRALAADAQGRAKLLEGLAQSDGPAKLLSKLASSLADSEGLTELLQGSCSSLIDASQPVLQRAISDGTERRNYWLFSLYRTELSAPKFIPGAPSYQFETVGLYRSLITIDAKQQ